MAIQRPKRECENEQETEIFARGTAMQGMFTFLYAGTVIGI